MLILNMAPVKPLPKFLVEEFNSKKNKIKFIDLRSGDTRKVWWKCKNGHEFFTSVNARRKKDIGGGFRICPECNKENKNTWDPPKILLEEFDNQKNSKALNKYNKSGTETLWWKCKNGHEFQSQIKGRFTYGIVDGKKVYGAIRECRQCNKEKKGFISKIPDILLNQFDPTLNDLDSIKDLPVSSKVSINWRCEINDTHIWTCSIASRFRRKKGEKTTTSPCPLLI